MSNGYLAVTFEFDHYKSDTINTLQFLNGQKYSNYIQKVQLNQELVMENLESNGNFVTMQYALLMEKNFTHKISIL